MQIAKCGLLIGMLTIQMGAFAQTTPLQQGDRLAVEKAKEEVQRALAEVEEAVKAVAAPIVEKQIDALADYLVTLFPMGTVYEMSAKNDEMWPIRGSNIKINAGELACIRKNLTASEYRTSIRNDLVIYSAKPDADLGLAIELFSTGFAKTIGDVVLESARQHISKEKTDLATRKLDSLTPAQAHKYRLFMESPQYEPLRASVGLDAQNIGRHAQGDPEKAGRASLIKFSLVAAEKCNVPISKFL